MQNINCSLMPLLIIRQITTKFCVLVWLHLGMCETETRNLQPISCLVLSNTVSLHLSEECNAQAIEGKCAFSCCYKWIFFSRTYESQRSSAQPRAWRTKLEKEGTFSIIISLFLEANSSICSYSVYL